MGVACQHRLQTGDSFIPCQRLSPHRDGWHEAYPAIPDPLGECFAIDDDNNSRPAIAALVTRWHARDVVPGPVNWDREAT